MTPNELLEQAKARIGSVLLVDEDQQLSAMLLTSIRRYRDLSGYCKKITIKSAGRKDLPSDFLAISSLKDSTEDALFVDIEQDQLGKYLTLPASGAPFTLRYFSDLLAIDMNLGSLPYEAEDLICEHLITQIKKENSKRLAVVEGMAEMDTSQISSPDSFDQMLLAIEERMKSQSILGDILSLQP
ncbi:hypothetical protein MHM93_14735 [Pseudoalteromonas sp. MM17-2]|uniref:hypothetical protein n=1 Tax=Pseudoalteromonas sp. MM17-2 TaxID=2917753 RepID=UPI001EF69A9B|nr:hypothetical protein [Pseudoalteromonas sp. MM17-2]MCG7545435.1 hypothetical protein [Pseudoalteromonas sp. MM17-2]